MNPQQNHPRFFLGANTPQGFVSRTDQLAGPEDGWRLFVLKGGPGCGKSTMLSAIADALGDLDDHMELIPCAADADSLDAVILPSLRVAVVDGTPPHPIEPKYPGAFESLIDLTVCWDEEKLFAARKSIIARFGHIRENQAHSQRYLAAAGALLDDTRRIAADCLKTAKLTGYTRRLAAREMKFTGRAGQEKIRFLSALTGKGPIFFTDTVRNLCERIYLINDPHGAVSRQLLSDLRTHALGAGYTIISAPCPLAPFAPPEHLLIPELGLGFVTSNPFHDLTSEFDAYRIVNSPRFTDTARLSPYRKRINLNKKSAAQLLLRAQALLDEAGRLHNELEGIYRSAVDFACADELTKTLITRLTPPVL